MATWQDGEQSVTCHPDASMDGERTIAGRGITLPSAQGIHWPRVRAPVRSCCPGPVPGARHSWVWEVSGEAIAGLRGRVERTCQNMPTPATVTPFWTGAERFGGARCTAGRGERVTTDRSARPGAGTRGHPDFVFGQLTTALASALLGLSVVLHVTREVKRPGAGGAARDRPGQGWLTRQERL